MINNQDRKEEIVESWNAVRKLQNSLVRCWMSPGGGMINERAPDETYNLPFVLAYAVLDNVLSELREQGDIKSKSWMLGAKMEASKDVLPWKNYDLVYNGKEDRNKLAHDAELIEKSECIKLIDAIEIELKEWGIL